MFRNLKAEMARDALTGRGIAESIGITEKSFSNKMLGKSEFTRAEMFKIQELFFENLALEYLFRWDNQDKTFSLRLL